MLADGKHTYNDFGLRMLSMSIPMPEAKTSIISVPYKSGDLDLTDVYGKTFYKDRKGIKFVFKVYDGSYSSWESKKSELANYLHGKKLKVILDDDKAYYYNMRLSVSSEKSDRVLSTITLEGTAEPYKQDTVASSEPWVWNTFNFVTGVISSSGEIDVNGSYTFVVPKGNMETTPTFVLSEVTSTTFTVSDGSHTVNLNTTGSTTDPRIKVGGDKAIIITFTGKGKVTTVYRGGSL